MVIVVSEITMKTAVLSPGNSSIPSSHVGTSAALPSQVPRFHGERFKFKLSPIPTFHRNIVVYRENIKVPTTVFL